METICIYNLIISIFLVLLQLPWIRLEYDIFSAFFPGFLCGENMCVQKLNEEIQQIINVRYFYILI